MTPADVLDVAFIELGRAVIVAGHYAFFTTWGWLILPGAFFGWMAALCRRDTLRRDSLRRGEAWRREMSQR